MKKQILLYLAIAILTIFSSVEFLRNKSLKKELHSTENELLAAQDEADEAKSKLAEVSDKLGISAGEIEDRIDNIQSYAGSLEGSISDLMREIRWADCDACYDVIWDIERKAKRVQSDFEYLQSEINQ